MKIWRALAFVTLALLLAGATVAQERITIVSPFPPGGPVDSLSRVLSDGLARRYGQTAVVENLAGAAGNIGMDKVKRAKPDGHTLLVIPAGNLTINPTLMPNFPFQVEKDFVPVTMLATASNVLVANPGVTFRSVQQLVAQAHAQPNQLSFASPGVGSGLHLAGELFKSQANVEILHVPYKGTAPALNDVMGGTVPLMFTNLPAVLTHLRSGKLIALGVTDKRRATIAPEIATFAEQGFPGVIVISWYGLMAPAGTPTDTVERLARDAREILEQPAVSEQLKAQGLNGQTMKPAEFGEHIRNESASWARIIKSRGITAD